MHRKIWSQLAAQVATTVGHMDLKFWKRRRFTLKCELGWRRHVPGIECCGRVRRTGYRSNRRTCITHYMIVVESSGDAGVRVIKQGDLGRGRHGADDPD